MPACRHAVAGRPVLTWPGRRDSRGPAATRLVSVRPAVGARAIVRAVFPGEEPVKPVPGRLPARPRRLCPAGLLPRPRHAGTPRPPCSGSPPHPLYLYLLKRPAV